MPVSAVRVLRAVVGEEPSDAELLRRFADRRDEAAFALLVRRHGPMVFGVCRRMLPEPDAEDAFQVVFLVLARKARTAAPREVASWLYGVARRAALVSRRAIARRRERTGEMPDYPAPEPSPLSALRAALDEELSRLPDIYRTVVVLCDLEGRTQREAAGVIGCPEGTVAGRLSRARELLAKRLARDAPAVSVTAVLSGTAAARVPAVLPPSATIPPGVAALTREVLGVMAGGKLMKAAAVVLLVGGTGFGMVLRAGQDAPGAPARTPSAAVPDARPAGGVEVRNPAVPEPFTAWGKEAGGLQAGLGVVGGKKAYRLGETVTLVVRVRNVGKEAVTFEYIRQYLDEHPPAVTGADGKAIPQATTGVTGVVHVPVAVSLEPGKDVVLGTRIHGTAGVPYDLWPAVGGGPLAGRNLPLRVGSGKIALRYDRVIGNSSIGSVKVDPKIAGLATGRLELEVSDADRPESLHVPTHDGMRELKGKDAADYRAGNAWLEERYREAASVKVGSTHADVVRYFRPDGGLMPVRGGRYVNVLCPLMKIDVEFEPGRGGVVPATARVTRVSRPYFEREFAD